jgi:uncharacterized Ntn-hydrolase superfamily protein
VEARLQGLGARRDRVTYSLVARDPATGELGVAVQSRSFGTGRVVPWAAAGVGAVATQSFSERSYGPRGLALLRDGAAPDEALAQLVAADELRDFRQVGLVDARGRTASHTGAACIPAAGARAGDGFSAQGNMLRSDEVVPALAEGFAAAEGTLAERLLAGLDAAETAGGDFRGREAGAILVVPAEGTELDRSIELGVDNHPEPLVELRRLLRHALALRRLRRADAGELETAFDEARAAGVDDDVARWVAAVALLPQDPERAESLLAPLAAEDERWRVALAAAAEVVRRTG